MSVFTPITGFILISLALSQANESQGCSQCPRSFKPVCDGVTTYNNLCQLECEATKNANVKFAYEGACCPSNSSCVKSYSPVCDSTGQTHPNECQFQYSSCIAKKTSGIELNIVKYVACSEAIESSIDHNVIRSTLPPVSRPNLVVSSSIDSQSAYSTRSFQRAKVPECNADCPEEYRPVCDNKGRTHNNKCQFDYENCQSKTETFYVVSLGVCPPQEPLLLVNGSANQPNRADSVPKILERTNLADCNSSCPRDYMPVCATNGNTYPNRCILDYANCLSVQDGHGEIAMSYVGPCTNSKGSLKQPEDPAITQSPHTKPATNPVKFTSVTDVTEFLNGGGDTTFPPLKIFQNTQKPTHKPTTTQAHSEDDCDSYCTKIYQPVCTTDNRTLDNRCSYDMENCRLRKAGRPPLKVAHDGPCVIDESAIVENPKFQPSAANNASVEVERPFDLADCHKTACPSDSSQPICDTDLGQHPNLCMFEQMSCLALHFKGTPLKIAHKGPCVNDSFTIDDQTKTLEKTEVADTRCNSNCPAVIEPVCDAYGKTYPHICVFNFMNCLHKNKTGQPLQLAHVGPCEGDTELFKSTPQPVESCPKTICTKEFRPVCGSNMNTFKNLCYFTLASCQHRLTKGTNLTVLHEGTCEEAAPTETAAVHSSAKTNSTLYEECPTECPDEESNVCATTGVTFKNLCRFNQAKCSLEKANGTRLVIANFGTCEAPEVFPRFNAENCISQCTKIWLPLCDTRRVTHSNLCEFNYESCVTFKKTGKSLTAAYMGECKTPEEEECGFSCMSNIDEPVCSTKGKQFPNLCSFNFANCKSSANHSDEILIAHFGRCQLTGSYDYAAVDFQQKSCSFSCSDDFDPVCSDSGKTFQNLCAYQFEACLQRKVTEKHQILVHKGTCEGGPLAPLIVDPQAKSILTTRWEASTTAATTTVPTTVESSTIAFTTTVKSSTIASTATTTVLPLHTRANHETTIKPLTKTRLYCPHYCDQTPSALCSNQNHSYATLCEFNEAKCKNLTEEITILHLGECNSSSVPYKLFFESCSTQVCDNTNFPLCDTENTTHVNFCSFKTADCVKRKLFKRGLTLKWFGDCSVPPTTTPQPQRREQVQKVTESSVIQQESLECSDNCPKNYQPLCDSKGKTHSNKCVFDFNSCVEVKQTGLPLTISHSGPCESTKPKVTSTLVVTQRTTQSRGIDSIQTSSAVPNPPKFAATNISSNCSSTCTREFKPVCSSTNDTYPNLCVFNYAKCLREEIGSTMELAHSGPCTDVSSTETSNSVCPAPICLKVYRPVCDSSGKEHENSCLFEHRRCLAAQQGITLTIANLGKCQPTRCQINCEPHELNQPICDSNFITHHSRCDFKKQKCLDNSTTEILFDGECSDCITDCPTTHSPLCSSSGRSFPNLCEFNVARCVYERRFHQNLTILYEDECCPPPNNCTLQPRAPVCASNGKIYDNQCSFEAEKCVAERSKGEQLTVVSDSACSLPIVRRNPIIDIAIDQTVAVNEVTEKIPTTVSLGTNQTSTQSGNSSCIKPCPKSSRPLCASDIQTYENLCQFENRQCAVGQILTVLHEGRCCSSGAVQCDFSPVCDADGKTHANLCSFEEHRCHVNATEGKTAYLAYNSTCCNRKCSKNYSPVCDSEGETHSNLCQFETQRCLKSATESKSLSVVNYGVCNNSRCSHECAKVYQPVCGSDGITYPNRCEMLAAICFGRLKGAEPLQLLYEGECCSDDCPTSFNPICDSEGVTHINPCVFSLKKCEAARVNRSLEVKSEGVCCSRPCTKAYRPVCASSGKTFSNICVFRVAQCEAEQLGEELWLDYKGKCCPSEDCGNTTAAPVCGSDMISYPNRCTFEHQQCVALRKNNHTIDVKHEGSCCVTEDCGNANDTVCDSQGRTHASECEYRNFKCHFERTNRITLDMAYRGSCCERPCPKLPEPICDQHGNQYNNRCEFEIVACRKSRLGQESLWTMKCARRAA